MLGRVSQSRTAAALQASEMQRCDGEQTLAALSLLAARGEDHPRWRRPPLLRHLHWEVVREKHAFAITPCPTVLFLGHPFPSMYGASSSPLVSKRPSAHQTGFQRPRAPD